MMNFLPSPIPDARHDRLLKFITTVLATVTAAGIIGLVTILSGFNTRLARIETKLEILSEQKSPNLYAKPDHIAQR
ncbi:MAG TPA: hypothetical protein VEH04_11350 [Verrucomicrobiae bacterium]|nr:hypothetical protein [Verrucomicrobiae bacterium]